MTGRDIGGSSWSGAGSGYVKFPSVEEPAYIRIPDGELAVSILEPEREGEVILEVKGPNEFLKIPKLGEEGKDVRLVRFCLATVSPGRTGTAKDWAAALNRGYKSEITGGLLQLKDDYRRDVRTKVLTRVEDWAEGHEIRNQLPFCN